MAWRQVAYNYLKAAAALRSSSREQLAVYMRLAAESDSATAYKRVLDDAGEVRLSSVLTLSGDAMAPAFLHGDQVRCVVTLPLPACCHPGLVECGQVPAFRQCISHPLLYFDARHVPCGISC